MLVVILCRPFGARGHHLRWAGTPARPAPYQLSHPNVIFQLPRSLSKDGFQDPKGQKKSRQVGILVAARARPAQIRLQVFRQFIQNGIVSYTGPTQSANSNTASQYPAGIDCGVSFGKSAVRCHSRRFREQSAGCRYPQRSHHGSRSQRQRNRGLLLLCSKR